MMLTINRLSAKTQKQIGDPVRSVLLIIILSVLMFGDPAFAQQTPTIPKSDDTVLVVLPKSFLANRSELSRLRESLNADPSDPKLAALVASQYLALGNRTGDPRFYGYARAAIDRWWATEADPAILKIRAKLKEKDHLYDEALLDLQSSLEQTPEDAQTRTEDAQTALEKAQTLIEIGNIYRVQGRYEESLAIADELQTTAGEVPAALCRTPVMAQTGKAQDAYDLLTKILPDAEINFPATVQFILTIRAEIADTIGKNQEVEKHFVEGLEKNPDDFYLLRGYSDYLLDQSKPAEALDLIREHTADTGVLLRAAIAADRSGDSELADQFTSMLETRFEELRLRGGQPHGRFESRYLLELKDDPSAALSVAIENWQKQKEVRDSRGVLEAAIAAKDPKSAKPVLDFLRSNNNEHVLLKKLANQLESIE